MRHLCCTAHKHAKKSPDNKDNGSTSAAFFSPRKFCCSGLAPYVSIEPKIGGPDMISLVQSRECAKATALFVLSFGADLVADFWKCGSMRLNFRFLVL